NRTGERRLQMKIENMQAAPVRKCNGCMEDRAVEAGLDFGIHCRNAIAERGYQIVPKLVARDDRQSAQDDRILDIGGSFATGSLRYYSRKGRIRCAGNECVEGRKRATAATRRFLPVHLLQAQNVGIELEELGPQHGDARRKRRSPSQPRVEVFKVEGCDA